MTVLSTDEVARVAGVSHRQLDYAYRHGILIPNGGRRGSGSRLAWSPAEVAVIRRLAEVAAELPFVEFGQLARCHAAALRAGQPAVMVGKWGEFRITPPTPAVTGDLGGELCIDIIDYGNGEFAVACGCGFETENPHSQSSAADIARGHNTGSHHHRGIIAVRRAA